MPDDILPPNIIILYHCINCEKNLEYPACPKCNPRTAEPLPPLGVHVSDTAGAFGKVGK